jgi:hypothetical protein
LLVFENSVCVACGTPQGLLPTELRLVPVPSEGSLGPCTNLDLAGCNWLAPAGSLCASCRLTRTRPRDNDASGMAAFAATERAKRRLVYQLLDRRLPVVPLAENPRGLAFDLLSSAHEQVVTGHADGVITIDLAEGQSAHREAMRVQMGEPYRTLLGHLRHEVGHFYWEVLIGGSADSPALQRFRDLFGDERSDYGWALEQHYRAGAPADWSTRFVSAYASAHPWEDWAETFAHYLHISDTLQTAAAYGMAVRGPSRGGADLAAAPRESAGEGIRGLVDTWLPLTFALNAVNRSMGKDDLYPFMLTEPVIAKLGQVHDLVSAA